MAKTKTVQAEAIENVQAAFESGAERLEQAQDQFLKFFSTFGDFAKGNIEALNVAASAATKGFEALGKAAAGYTKDAASASQETLATLRGAKSPTEFFELNQTRAKAHYDHFVGEASKISELLVKVAGEVIEPISTRYAVAMDQVTKTAAR